MQPSTAARIVNYAARWGIGGLSRMTESQGPGSRLTTPGLALQGRRGFGLGSRQCRKGRLSSTGRSLLFAGSSPSSPLPLLPSFHVGFRVGDSRSFLQTACASLQVAAPKLTSWHPASSEVSSEDPLAEAGADPCSRPDVSLHAHWRRRLELWERSLALQSLRRRASASVLSWLLHVPVAGCT